MGVAGVPPLYLNLETRRTAQAQGGRGVTLDGETGACLSPEAGACVNLWFGAVRQYYIDARSYMRGVKHGHDEGESLDDLTGSRRLLEALCEPLGADPQVVGDAMVEVIDAELRKPKAKHKRRGKPEAVTLG